VAWFYEIRSSNNALLKRDGGFPTADAAKVAARDDAKRDDAKKMTNASKPNRLDVGRILVGQNNEQPTRS
jgi:hypothetical protein